MSSNRLEQVVTPLEALARDLVDFLDSRVFRTNLGRVNKVAHPLETYSRNSRSFSVGKEEDSLVDNSRRLREVKTL